MISLVFDRATRSPLRLLCLGAHSDDIEIGCGATILKLLAGSRRVHVDWVVFAARGERAAEAKKSAGQFLRRAATRAVDLHAFRDGYFPSEHAAIKDVFEAMKGRPTPDVILTHYRNDLHQDHRVIGELTRNTWRDHLILEYEIPKYDGDLDRPNMYVPVSAAQVSRKISILMRCFATQADRRWFDEETFRSILRIRGVEANSPTRYAEAFHGFKTVIL